MNTVGELKEFIKNLSDDMPLISQNENFELKGKITRGIYPQISKFRIENQKFMDFFDYTEYSCDIYTYDINGKECLKI